MKKLSEIRALFHAIVERDVEKIKYGQISYTVFVKGDGDPDLKTLKITKAKRKKYS